MEERPSVTLQINLAPGDLRHCRETLPHLIRQWGGQVSEVLFTMDAPDPVRTTADAKAEVQGLRELVERCSSMHPNVRCTDVDTSSRPMRGVSEMFFGGRKVPTHDLRHRPIYAYFFGLFDAQNDHVFHLDSDMMFGGGSQSWMAEAVDLLRSRPDVLTCSPLPGPPTRDGRLRTQQAERDAMDSLAFRFDHVSTRLFLLDRRGFAERVGGLRPRVGPWKSAIRAAFRGLPPYDFAEGMMGRAMRNAGLIRIDFLGRQPGMWSVHPLHHTERYYQGLRELIRRVEAGLVPEEQRGAYDITEPLLERWLSDSPAAVDSPLNPAR